MHNNLKPRYSEILMTIRVLSIRKSFYDVKKVLEKVSEIIIKMKASLSHNGNRVEKDITVALQSGCTYICK